MPPPPLAVEISDSKLLDHFVTYTGPTLTYSTSLRTFWKQPIVRCAERCDYVRHAVLAVTAIHLAYEESTTREQYLLYGIQHQQQAMQPAIKLLGSEASWDLDTPINLFLFSILTVYFGS